MVLFDGLKHMGHGRGKYEKHGWAQVGQVDPTWTNYGQKELILGFKIQVKVYGTDLLEEKQCLVMKYMHLKGKIDLNCVLAGTCFPYNFDMNWWAQG